MKKSYIVLLLPLLLLNNCHKNNDLKTICPIGAPSAIFFTEGNSDNFVTESITSKVLAEFQKDEYDAIVIDSMSGLSAIKKYNSPYRYAKLLTSGNLYLISFKYDRSPINGDSILAFGNKNSIPLLTLKSTCVNKLGKSDFDEKCEINDSVSNVLIKMGENIFYKDYFLLAEPLLSNFKMNNKDKKILYEKRLNSETLFNESIPQAALFVNVNSYKKSKDKFISYNNKIKDNISKLINSPTEVISVLNKYGSVEKIKSRFGFSSSIINTVQENNKNGLAIYSNDSPKYTSDKMNAFLDKIMYDKSIRFNNDYFIDIDE